MSYQSPFDHPENWPIDEFANVIAIAERKMNSDFAGALKAFSMKHAQCEAAELELAKAKTREGELQTQLNGANAQIATLNKEGQKAQQRIKDLQLKAEQSEREAEDREKALGGADDKLKDRTIEAKEYLTRLIGIYKKQQDKIKAETGEEVQIKALPELQEALANLSLEGEEEQLLILN